MEVYFLIFFILIGLNVVEILYDNKNISIISGVLLAFFAGFRFYTGYDFMSYEDYFTRANTLSNVSEMSDVLERGYLYLAYFFNAVGLNYYTFVLFFALLSIGLLTFYLYRNFEFPTAALVLYYARFYILRDMAQVRSSLAAIILLFSLKYMKERKLFKFLLVTYIASLFHVAALVFLLAYIFNVIVDKLDVKSGLFFTIAAMFIGVLIQYPALYAGFVPQRFISYVTAPSWMGAPWFLNPIVYMQMMILIGSYVSAKYVILNKKRLNEMYTILNAYFLASLALISTNVMRVMGGRVSTFFATLEILIVPTILLKLTRNKLLNLVIFTGFTIIIFLLIFVMSNRYNVYIPYKTPFNFY